MGPALYLMAILGCGESDAPCQEVRTAAIRYETESACLAALEAEVGRHQDLEFPVVVAQCRPAEAQPAMLRANEVLLPKPEINPHYPPQGADSNS